MSIRTLTLCAAVRYGRGKQEFSFQSGCERSKLPIAGQYGGSYKKYCQKTGQPVPESVGELASVVYRSLAQSYGETVSSLEKIAGRTYDSIHIIGGGSNAAYLNQLTADATGKTVYAGPGEATAIGNLLAQMIYAEELTDLKSARQCVRDSFEIKTFVPAK